MDFPVFQSVPSFSCFSLGTTKKSVSILFAPFLQIHADKFPLEPSLLQAEWSQLSQPFLILKMLQSLSNFSGPSLDSSISLLYWGHHDWTQHYSCGLTGAAQKERITFFYLLAVLFLMQPKRLLPTFAARAHWWFNLCQLASPDPFLLSSFPAIWPPACTGAWGYSSRGAGLHISLCCASWDPSWPGSPACLGPSEWQHNHLMYQSLHPDVQHL